MRVDAFVSRQHYFYIVEPGSQAASADHSDAAVGPQPQQHVADACDDQETGGEDAAVWSHSAAIQDCETRDHGIETDAPAPQSEFRPTGATKDKFPESKGVTDFHNVEAALTADMNSTADAASSEESDLDSCLSGPPNGKYSAEKGWSFNNSLFPSLERRRKKLAVLEQQRQREETLARKAQQNRKQGESGDP